VTTPGAGWYKTNGKQAFQHIHLQVKDIRFWNGFSETMLFDGANAHSETRIHLSNCEFYWLGYVGTWSTGRAETFQSGCMPISLNCIVSRNF
jgi:urease accessory protein